MSVIYINPYNFGVALDADAAAYIARVEGASGDNQALEQGVKDAINAFVIGCKADGIWTAIKASCILAGARTLAGALQPLVGTAPTNNNFVTGDYNRETGLAGNGSSKYLDSNRTGNADPVDNHSAGVYVYTGGTPSNTTQIYLGNFPGSGSGSTNIGFDSNQLFFRSRNDNIDRFSASTDTGLVGLSRSSGSTYSVRANQQDTSFTRGTQTANTANIILYRDNSGAFPFYTNARFAFYFIGESLNLALLDSRVTALINAYTAAIP
mgnify:CR=1 FL=1